MAGRRRANAPRKPTKSQLDRLVKARGQLLGFRMTGGRDYKIDKKLWARYEKALKPCLKRMEAKFLSSENQQALDERAVAWWRKHGWGPGKDW